MVRLVDDLLDVNRISRGERRAAAGAASTSPRVVEQRRRDEPAGRRGVRPRAGRRPASRARLRATADLTRLAQVIGNLLNNAAKYTEPGGRIRIEVEREADEVLVRVRDNGLGIPADDAAQAVRDVQPGRPAAGASRRGAGHRSGPCQAARGAARRPGGRPQPATRGSGGARGGQRVRGAAAGAGPGPGDGPAAGGGCHRDGDRTVSPAHPHRGRQRRRRRDPGPVAGDDGARDPHHP